MGEMSTPTPISKELAEGEIVLWWGKPMRIPFIPLPTLQFLFCLVFIPFWFSSIHRASIEKPDSLMWFQLPILFCLGILSIYHFIGPSRQIYAVTNSRVIIIQQFLSSRVSSIQGFRLTKMQVDDCKGIGSIYFDEKPAALMFDPAMQIFPATLFKIERPSDVAKLIQNTFNLKATP